jgi:hypothetical protein
MGVNGIKQNIKMPRDTYIFTQNYYLRIVFALYLMNKEFPCLEPTLILATKCI